MRKSRLVLPAVVVAAALMLTGCVNNEASSDTAKTDAASSSVKKDDALAKLLPAAIASSGTLKVGMDPTYAPNEYKDNDGNPIGWEVDFTNAIAAKLGLKVSYQVAKFDNIIPSITGGKYDMGMSSFTDNAEREKTVTFVNYYSAGIQWATKKGVTIDPDNACGKKVAVQSGTYEDLTEVADKSKACTDAGKPAIDKLKYDAQDDATNAVILGQVDAFSADSPVTAYGVKQSKGKLQLAGDVFDVAPYGIPVQKDSKLADVLKQTVQSLIDDGTYGKILKQWGVENGAVTSADINGATKS